MRCLYCVVGRQIILLSVTGLIAVPHWQDRKSSFWTGHIQHLEIRLLLGGRRKGLCDPGRGKAGENVTCSKHVVTFHPVFKVKCKKSFAATENTFIRSRSSWVSVSLTHFSPPLPVSKYLFRRSCSRLLLYPYSYMCLKSRAELQPHLAFMHIFRQKAGIKLFEIRYWKKKIFIWQLSRFFLLPLADFFHQLSRSQAKIGKHYSSKSSRPTKICGSLYWTQIRSVDLVWFGFIIGPCEQEHLKAQYVHCTSN